MKSATSSLSIQVLDIAKHDYRGAKEHLERLLDQAGLESNAATHLGLEFFRQSELIFAQRCFERALVAEPKSATVQNFLGLCHQKLGDHTRAMDYFVCAYQSDASLQSAIDNLNNSLSYIDGNQRQLIGKQLSEFVKVHSPVNYLEGDTEFQYGSQETQPASKIRLAYLIDDFRSRFYQRLIKPMIESHNQQTFEVIVFYADPIGTNELDDHIEVIHLNRAARNTVCKAIAAYNLDILVYVAADSPYRMGHVLEHRVAKQQVNFPSPGSLSIDSWRTPLFGWLYRADPTMPTPACFIEPRAELRVGYLGSHKAVSHSQTQHWLRSMAEVPSIRFRLATPLLAVDSIKADLQTYLGAEQVEVDLLEMPKTSEDYWAFLTNLDIAVTAYPVVEPEFVFDCLAVGIPVIFRTSDSLASNYIEKLLTNIGLKDWIAYSDDEVGNILENKAKRPQERLEIKQFSHHRLRTSLLMHKEFFMHEYQQNLINLGKNHE